MGIPGIGSLTCLAPQSCASTCTAVMTEPCHWRALCTLSEGDGQHHCDCSWCQGPTKAQTDYEAHCKDDSCEPGETCYWNRRHFSADGSSECVGDGDKGKVCKCEFPKVRNQTGACMPCPGGKDPKYDQERKIFYCDKSDLYTFV